MSLPGPGNSGKIHVRRLIGTAAGRVSEWLKTSDSKLKNPLLAMYSHVIQSLICSMSIMVISISALAALSRNWLQKSRTLENSHVEQN
jgi:hypothetical protein